ncbi:hypothetical protein LZZ90_13385 [Flavobacterium sp. SM15]|uniref:hypothetical protein n=1 Tax=Flavobacterium sp. SM15 TaxID=2908005 RepID=UPI001EDAC86C|nr:hypothetical protein [Flavobacterium sp. SM15]MCG2612502.1 hypothetical protein [Flavobacterium sp. SM15]
MKFLKNIALVFLLFVGFNASAQAYRFETTGVSMSIKNAKGKWSPYSDFKDVKIVITLDTNKDRIVVYSEVIQLYTILAYEGEDEAKNDGIDTFQCVNNDGEKCVVTIRSDKASGAKQLYIKEDSRVLVYNMKLVK